MNTMEDLDLCTHRFIDLANELGEGKYPPQLVSAALMSASGIYATFVAAGNEGGLEPSGVDKVVELYRASLENIQLHKKARAEAAEKAANND